MIEINISGSTVTFSPSVSQGQIEAEFFGFENIDPNFVHMETAVGTFGLTVSDTSINGVVYDNSDQLISVWTRSI